MIQMSLANANILCFRLGKSFIIQSSKHTNAVGVELGPSAFDLFLPDKICLLPFSVILVVPLSFFKVSIPLFSVYFFTLDIFRISSRDLVYVSILGLPFSVSDLTSALHCIGISATLGRDAYTGCFSSGSSLRGVLILSGEWTLRFQYLVLCNIQLWLYISIFLTPKQINIIYPCQFICYSYSATFLLLGFSSCKYFLKSISDLNTVVLVLNEKNKVPFHFQLIKSKFLSTTNYIIFVEW